MSNRHNYVFLGSSVLLISIVTVHLAPVTTMTEAEKYLSKYGYLPTSGSSSNSDALMDANTWSKGVEDFQRFAGLNVTGELNEETLKMMSQRRCSNPDKTFLKNNKRVRRYITEGSRWNKTSLTFKITKYSKNLYYDAVNRELTKAFDIWSKYSSLNFKLKAYGPADIEIKFVEGEHGHNDPFDGLHGLLAHAFYPKDGGEIHFDDAEPWTGVPNYGEYLLETALHEIGHSLGLKHSQVPHSIMYPFMYKELWNKLGKDDILAVQTLYGNKKFTDWKWQ